MVIFKCGVFIKDLGLVIDCGVFMIRVDVNSEILVYWGYYEKVVNCRIGKGVFFKI